MPATLNRLSILFINYRIYRVTFTTQNTFIEVFPSIPNSQTCMCKHIIIPKYAKKCIIFGEKAVKVAATLKAPPSVGLRRLLPNSDVVIPSCWYNFFRMRF